ncbi:MAG: winged helix-turn-helix domain-containing protein [Isosphaeraceae bacterium]
MRRPENREPSTPDGAWTFLSNHGHVLLCIAADPEIRLRDVADRVGITERAVQRIVADLESGHYVTRIRIGRQPLPDPLDRSPPASDRIPPGDPQVVRPAARHRRGCRGRRGRGPDARAAE